EDLYHKSKKIAKTLHEEACPGAIYDIGLHYLPDNSSVQHHLWVCMETGQILRKEPKLKTLPKPEVKKVAPKPVKVKPPVKVKKKVKLVVEKPLPEPEVLPAPESIPTKSEVPTVNTLTSVSEVKGIGKAVYEKLADANIKTIGDLLSKHSQEIATSIGRKSDVQIKKWQEAAQKMLTGT
ncbi:MAG: hypothetical protein JSV04_02815, partial [Candidatus Heimdallarchaeota archaeon]